MVLVSLELYHGVNDVFQYLRSGYGSILCYMSDKYHRHSTRLGESQRVARDSTSLTFARVIDSQISIIANIECCAV